MDDAAKAALVSRCFAPKMRLAEDRDFGLQAYQAFLEARRSLDEQDGEKHQNPDWVRRCVASVVHGGSTKKKSAPKGTDRGEVSKAFAICKAQYKKLSSGQKGSAQDDEKKWGKRMGQYKNILKAARKKK